MKFNMKLTSIFIFSKTENRGEITDRLTQIEKCVFFITYFNPACNLINCMKIRMDFYIHT